MYNSGESKIRQTQSENVRKRFLDTIRRYQEIESDYRQKYRHRVERQIRIGWCHYNNATIMLRFFYVSNISITKKNAIVKPEATEEEVEQMMDSDQGTQVFTQSVKSFYIVYNYFGLRVI